MRVTRPRRGPQFKRNFCNIYGFLDQRSELLASINMRVFTVATGMLRISAQSSTEFSW